MPHSRSYWARSVGAIAVAASLLLGTGAALAQQSTPTAGQMDLTNAPVDMHEGTCTNPTLDPWDEIGRLQQQRFADVPALDDDVVDDDVDVHDHEAVLFHLCANCDPGRDLEIVNGPLDILDHAAPRLGAGHKIGFDATRKIKGEECGGHAVRDWPNILSMSDDVRSLVDRRWREYGL